MESEFTKHVEESLTKVFRNIDIDNFILEQYIPK